ncbi:MAG: transcription initiation factor IIB [Candidatus Hodarchaeales archaeon]|jgi:transcription initiation factor TFIIB
MSILDRIQSENFILTQCSECNNTDIITDVVRGETICQNCGLVINASMVASGKEWRSYNSYEEKKRSRVGDPISPLMPDTRSSSIGLGFNRDAKGNMLPAERRWDFHRLANIDNRRNGEIRNLRIALRELQRITSHLGIGESIARTASIIYRKSLKANLIRGRSIDCVIAASLYIACRKEGIPITLKDIQSRANAAPKELSRCVRVLISHLKIRPKNSSPEAFVQRLADMLTMTMHTSRIGVKIVGQAKKAGIIQGKNPISVAAAALYIAGVKTGERRTQQQLANAARTTPVTIRNRFKELMNVLGMDEIEIKRGAAAIPQYISDPLFFIQQQKKDF